MEFRDRKFKFMDTVYTIRFVDRCPVAENQDNDAFNFGLFDPRTHVIYITLKDPETGKPYPKGQIMNVLRHELVHMLFFEGQYHDCNEDEPLVEWLSKGLGLLLRQDLL